MRRNVTTKNRKGPGHPRPVDHLNDRKPWRLRTARTPAQASRIERAQHHFLTYHKIQDIEARIRQHRATYSKTSAKLPAVQKTILSQIKKLEADIARLSQRTP